MDNDPNTDMQTAPSALTPSSSALAYLSAATAILQALATDAATIASDVGGNRLAGHITGALSTFQMVQQPIQDIEQLAVGIFGFFGQLAASHAAAKKASS